jgi:formate-dependent nitrite reductase membrane component NrfD
MQYVGFTVMPVVGSALSVLGQSMHTTGVPYFTQYSVPAIFMLLMSLAAVVLLFTVYDKVSSQSTTITCSTRVNIPIRMHIYHRNAYTDEQVCC